jgi:perosamine synthetase
MKVSQSKPSFSLEDYDALQECWNTQWFTEGPYADEFIKQINMVTDAEYCVLAPNGTLALFLGLLAIDIKENDLVIVPNSTFIASANAVWLAKATPLFVDVGEDQQIDVDKCEELMKVHRNVKVIMPVHLWGSACNMTKVLHFAKKYNLKIIEDAAQAFGVKYKDKGCGSFGDVGCFSFFADKAISTIEGGAVTTNNKKIYEKLMYLRNQGRMHRGTFVHPELGVNFRINDLQCVLGLQQIKNKEYIFSRRKEIFELYKENLNGIEEVRVIEPLSESTHIPFRTVVLTKDNQQDVSDFMKDKGIEIRTVFYPLHKQPCFQKIYKKFKYKDEDFVNSIYAFEHGLCLPNYPQLKDEEILYVCNTIKEYYDV